METSVWSVLISLVFLFLIVIVWISWKSRSESVPSCSGAAEQKFTSDEQSVAYYGAITAAVEEMGKPLAAMKPVERLKATREMLDAMAGVKDYAEQILAVSEGGIEGEWVLPASGVFSHKILYLHGGGFSLGSPLSHRAIAAGLARHCDAAVFSLRYSLLPEHPRKKMIEDCRRAYRWLAAAQAPGTSSGNDIVLAGDSAGANLALVTARWVSRQTGLPAPSAVVALSPGTDTTLTAVTRANVETDRILGPLLRPALKLPPYLWRLAVLLQFRVWANDPEISPLFGDLSGLPKTLIQVSRSELMYGDALSYAAKAKMQGAAVEVQSWNGLPHVWLLFDVDCEVAAASWAEIARFVGAPRSV